MQWSEQLKDLNECLKKKELIDKFYTEPQKCKLRKLQSFTAILSFLPVVVFIVTMCMSGAGSIFQRSFGIILFVAGLFFLIPAAFIGRSLRRMQRRFGVAILNSGIYEGIITTFVDNVDDGLGIIRLYKFQAFCNQNSIIVTKDYLSFIKDFFADDAKNFRFKIADWSIPIKWFKVCFTFLITTFFSFYFSISKNIESILSIYISLLVIVLLVGCALLLFNMPVKDWRDKHMNKYQCLLKTIEAVEYEIAAGKSDRYCRLSVL